MQGTYPKSKVRYKITIDFYPEDISKSSPSSDICQHQQANTCMYFLLAFLKADNRSMSESASQILF